MKKLKDILKESYVWERKFGEKLLTLADVQKKKLNEVGAAPIYKKHLFNIKKAENNYNDAIMDFKKFMMKQGNRSEAKEMSSKFVTIVGKFQKWFEREIVRMIRKSI